MRACSGRQPIMHTIIAGKMEMVLPAMYMMNKFMGICFSGASATSQQRCRKEANEASAMWGYLVPSHGGRGRSPPRGNRA
uniref:Uncharacterized protein n=1 Tax=Falco tinnunculus TaxID=100819 RepID=A0A8C4UXW7_FALTI